MRLTYLRILIYIFILFVASHIIQLAHANCPSVPAGCFCNSKKKGGLKIRCHGLKTVSFSNLPKDVNTDIDLSSNELEKINTTTFPSPNRIRKLDLKDNLINEIEDDTFQGFTNLKKIDLSRNRLSQINASTFAGLGGKTSITILNLQNNMILYISQRAFSNMQIERLILRKQLNLSKKEVELIAYHDFLTLSLIKYVNLDGNNLLCDCNMKWLVLWVLRTQYQVSPNSTCQFPKQIRKTLILQLVKAGSEWDCDLYKSSFSLPHFQMSPAFNQLLFENDSFPISCESTYIEGVYILWKINGVDQKTDKIGINVRHHFNAVTGLYKSTLVISRLNANDHGNISCQLRVHHGSGTITSSIKLYIINRMKESCMPDLTAGNRGKIYWSTALDGSTTQMSCPYGGLISQLGFRKCANGTWDDPILKDCLFRSRVTRALQIYYNSSKSYNRRDIISMGKSFYLFFRKNYYNVKTKYDLYYIHQVLEKIMYIFGNLDGRSYSEFFWGSLGLIAQTNVKLHSITEFLYGSSGEIRFRHLVESFVEQEAEKSGKYFKINNHRSMAALSYKQRTEVMVHCHVKPPDKSQKMIQLYCSPGRNKTVEKVSSINLQLVVGVIASEVRITIIVYLVKTFFQGTMETKSNTVIVAPILGVKIMESVSLHESNISKQALITFKDMQEISNPKFMVWKNNRANNGIWKESTDCTLLERHRKSVIQFQCHFINMGETIYFTLAMDRPTNLHAKPSYMEVILYIGAGISCLFIALTLSFYAIIKTLRFNRSDAATLMNLCFALIIVEFVFVCGLHRTDNRLICKWVAMSLHYFLLCALVWLGCGGVVLIRLLKKKYNPIREHDPILKYYLVGWGLPLIVCSVTIAYDRNNYGTAKYCWMAPKSSLAGFIFPGSLILLTDLIIFCCLHALINRIYPEAEEDAKPSEEMLDANKCNSNSCKYKVKKCEDRHIVIPKRNELINYLHGCLSVLLLFCLTFTFALMMYSYKSSSVLYLYYLFAYGSAFCNFSLGAAILFFHCIKGTKVRFYIKQYLTHCCHGNMEGKLIQDNVASTEQQVRLLGPKEEDDRCQEPPDFLTDDFPSTLGAGECILSESLPAVVTVQDDLFESIDDNVNTSSHVALNSLLNNSLITDSVNVVDASFPTPAKSQSEISDVEFQSIGGCNSIGECSLTSGTHTRVRPKNPDIPENLKSFVPQDWRPARRRKTIKGNESYYPYFNTDITPMTASYAYSSKSSSIASTTVSGVPLYINKKRAANNIAMYNDMFNNVQSQLVRPQLNCMVPLPKQINFPSSPEQSGRHNHNQYPLDPSYYSYNSLPVNIAKSLQPSCFNQMDSGAASVDIHYTPKRLSGRIIEEEEGLDGGDCVFRDKCIHEDEDECLIEEKPIKVAPIIYIPMPHVSIKQFEPRCETSV